MPDNPKFVTTPNCNGGRVDTRFNGVVDLKLAFKMNFKIQKFWLIGNYYEGIEITFSHATKLYLLVGIKETSTKV